MTGKQKCKILKEIRRQIAENNDIRFVVEECTHKGKCRGTCPKCEAEVRMLERELEKRRAAGKKVVITGISAGFLLTSCTPIDTVKEFASSVVDSINGERQVETATMGDPLPETLAGEPADTVVTEGVPLAPEMETEMGEVIPDDEVVGTLPVDDDSEDCDIPEETEEEELQIAGGILPVDQEEPVLEGDNRYSEEDEGEQP